MTGDEACRHVDPETFFPNVNDRRGLVAARTVCGACPSRQPCQDYGLAHEVWGIWGGLDPQERRDLRRRLGIVAEPVELFV